MLKVQGVGRLISVDTVEEDEDDFNGLRQQYGTEDTWAPISLLRPATMAELQSYFEKLHSGWESFKSLEQAGEYAFQSEVNMGAWSGTIPEGTKAIFTPHASSFFNPLPSSSILKRVPSKAIPKKDKVTAQSLKEEEFRKIPGVRVSLLPSMMQALVHPSTLTKVEYNEDIWSQLVIPEKMRDRLLVLLGRETKNRKRVYGDWGMNLLHKGSGLKILLQGPPGTGKTMTAEAISAKLKRPLLRVGAAYARNEDWIEKMFEFASKWNMIVLFDEAEAFIAHRKHGDLDHNAIVSIMLRHMENFKGVMILTTNKLPDISNAAKNRIHATFTFGMPTPEERLRITKGNIPKEMPVEDLDKVLEYISNLPITGRQIGYVVLEAASWAADMNLDHVPLKYFQDSASHVIKDSHISVEQD